MTAGLVTYLMTAGLASDDYRFLGRAPKDTFWRRYADFTSFERPTAILLVKDGAFRAYLSGIASARRDRTKTPLRYSLVLEGPCRTPAADSLLRALSVFIEDLADVTPGPLKVGALGRALDATFPEPFVEAALTGLRDAAPPPSSKPPVPPTGILGEIEARVEQAFSSLPSPDAFARADHRFFSGGRASPASRSRFLGFVERLLIDGEPGAALVVNLASRDHLGALAAEDPACAVLFAGENGEEAFSDPLEQPPKKGSPGSPRGLPRAIDLAGEARAEPGFSIPGLTRLLLGAYRTVRTWLLGHRESS